MGPYCHTGEPVSLDKCNLEAEINRLNIAAKALKLVWSKPIGCCGLIASEPSGYSCKRSNVRRRTAYEHWLLKRRRRRSEADNDKLAGRADLRQDPKYSPLDSGASACGRLCDATQLPIGRSPGCASERFGQCDTARACP